VNLENSINLRGKVPGEVRRVDTCSLTYLSIFVAATVLPELLQDFEELPIGVGFVGEAHLDLVDELDGPVEFHCLPGLPTVVHAAIVVPRWYRHLRRG